MSNSVINIMKILGQKAIITSLKDSNATIATNQVPSLNGQQIKPNNSFDPALLYDCLTRLPDPANTPLS